MNIYLIKIVRSEFHRPYNHCLRVSDASRTLCILYFPLLFQSQNLHSRFVMSGKWLGGKIGML